MFPHEGDSLPESDGATPQAETGASAVAGAEAAELLWQL